MLQSESQILIIRCETDRRLQICLSVANVLHHITTRFGLVILVMPLFPLLQEGLKAQNSTAGQQQGIISGLRRQRHKDGATTNDCAAHGSEGQQRLEDQERSLCKRVFSQPSRLFSREIRWPVQASQPPRVLRSLRAASVREERFLTPHTHTHSLSVARVRCQQDQPTFME